MPTYPTLRTEYGSSKSTNVDRVVDRATNGSARARIFFTSTKASFSLKHNAITSAEKVTFETFHLTNLSAVFSYTFPGDGLTYTCLFASEPTYTPVPGNRWDISVELIES